MFRAAGLQLKMLANLFQNQKIFIVSLPCCNKIKDQREVKVRPGFIVVVEVHRFLISLLPNMKARQLLRILAAFCLRFWSAPGSSPNSKFSSASPLIFLKEEKFKVNGISWNLFDGHNAIAYRAIWRLLFRDYSGVQVEIMAPLHIANDYLKFPNSKFCLPYAKFSFLILIQLRSQKFSLILIELNLAKNWLNLFVRELAKEISFNKTLKENVVKLITNPNTENF